MGERDVGFVGERVGFFVVGGNVGKYDGFLVGVIVGSNVGFLVGEVVGCFVGKYVGGDDGI